MPIPRVTDLFNPVLTAMKALGGSASIYELDEKVINNLTLTDKEVGQLHRGGTTEIQYRLAWARTYLKIYGVLENSERKIWVLTSKGREVDSVDPLFVARYVRDLARSREKNPELQSLNQPTIENNIELADSSITEIVPVLASEQIADLVEEKDWRVELLQTLQAIPPDSFERLCQRLLRESGFVEVIVTGRTNDGGIDGIGTIRLGGLLSFPVIFQCKRYQGTVGSPEIRNFRGAMAGRTDRGLFITTGNFSREAKKEANRDGVPPIDLIDGELLMDKLKELGLGVTIKMIEEVSVIHDFFENI